MQFQAVPAGTTAAQALTIRGGDPEVEMTSNHNYFKMLGDAQRATFGAGNARFVKYSSVAGTILNFMFTSDATFLGYGAIAEAVDPAELNTAFQFLTQHNFTRPKPTCLAGGLGTGP